jgi:uncharacterized protein (DUF58 family)
MLSTADILKKVRALDIKSKRLTTNVFGGEYHSAFKGRGMSFKEVREYAHGDDIRFIDWNTSARFGHPFSKVFEEERELTVMLLIDCSASNTLGSKLRTKQELIAELAAVLAFSAVSNGDKVGAIFFSDGLEKYIAPKKGRQHVLYIVRHLVSLEPRQKGTNLAEGIRFLNKTVKHNAIVFMLSDFDTNGYDKALKTIAKRHDCIGIHIYDKLDYSFPDLGLVPLQDAETGQVIWQNSGDETLQTWWKKSYLRQKEATQTALVQSGWDYLPFATTEDYVHKLQMFFLQRIKR